MTSSPLSCLRRPSSPSTQLRAWIWNGVKLHKACKDSTVTAVLDNTTPAFFGHQTLLALQADQHFDAFKCGCALAGTGRSAPTGPAAFNEQVARETHLRTMQAQWPALLAFGGDHEITSTSVSNLWSAVTFVMSLRTARAAHWGVYEVVEACRLQLDSLPAYSSAVASPLAWLQHTTPRGRSSNK
jgi:hypothetical protein